jgi:hypothetical protein
MHTTVKRQKTEEHHMGSVKAKEVQSMDEGDDEEVEIDLATQFKLLDGEGRAVVFDREALMKQSMLLQESTKDMPADELEDCFVVPNARAEDLKQVRRFVDYAKDKRIGKILRPLKSNNLVDNIVPRLGQDKDAPTHKEWYAKFAEDLEFPRQVCAISDIANFLNMKDLLYLMAATIAVNFKGKSPEAIAKEFNVAIEKK